MSLKRSNDFGSLAVLLVSLLSLFPLRNNDVWWHLTAGRWMVENVRVPDLDVFSHTGFMGHWTDNEWLAQLLFYGAWRVGGNAGLVLLRVVLFTSLFLLLCAYLRRARRPSMTFPAIVVATCLSYSWWELRPSVFSLVGMLALLVVLEGLRHGSSPPWLLPCLFLPWANLHPGFLFGLMVLFASVAAMWVERILPRERRFSSDSGLPMRLSLWSLVSLGVTFVNPYGPRVFEQQFRIAGNLRYRSLLDEWAPPSIAFLVLVLVVVAMFLALRYRRVPLPVLVPILACSALSTTGVRFQEYFALLAVPAMLAYLGPVRRHNLRLAFVAVVLLGSGLVGLLPPMGSALREGVQAVDRLDAVDQRLQMRQWRNVALFAGLTMASVFWAMLSRERLRWSGRLALPAGIAGVLVAGTLLLVRPLPNDSVERDRYPDACLAALPHGSRAFHKLSWGGWLMWKAEQQTYIDGRCWGQPIFFEYREARSPQGDGILTKRGIDTVILPPSDSLAESLATSRGWEQVCEDDVSVVYRLAGEASLSAIEAR